MLTFFWHLGCPYLGNSRMCLEQFGDLERDDDDDMQQGAAGWN